MYTSWFKNEPHPEKEETYKNTGEMLSQTIEEELFSCSTNFGLRLFLLFMMFISFGLTALVLYFPSVGVPAAICGFPLAVILLCLWILRALF